MGDHDFFTQLNIDGYFLNVEKADKAKVPKERDSTSTKQLRKQALKFYLNECKGLNLNFKKVNTKGRSGVNPHQAYTRSEINELLDTAEHDKQMHSLV